MTSCTVGTLLLTNSLVCNDPSETYLQRQFQKYFS